MAARSGPAAILPRPVSIRKNTGSTAADLNPSSTKTLNKQETAEILSSGSDKFGVKTEEAQANTEEKGVYQQFPTQVENQVSLKSEEVMMKTEETLTKAESEPEFNNLQVWTENSEERAETPMSDSQTVVEETLHSNSEKRASFFEIPHMESNTQTWTEERAALEPQTKETLGKTTNVESVSWTETERKGTLCLQQSSKTEDTKFTTSKISNLESNSRPKGEQGQHLESNFGSKVEERLNLKTEFDSKSKHEDKRLGGSKPPDLESNPGLRGEKSLEVGESRRKEEKRPKSEEKRKEVKAGGKKLSVR